MSEEELNHSEDEKKSDSSEQKRQDKRDEEMSDTIEESIVYWQDHDEFSGDLVQVEKVLNEVMGLSSSFDVDFRKMNFGGIETGILFISGFTDSDIMTEILTRLTHVHQDQVCSEAMNAFFN